MKESKKADSPAALRRRVILLGPQRLFPTLVHAVDSLGLPGRIAAVTAGWEEREGEDQELSAHLGGRTVNLRIWERGEDAYGRDKELHAAVRDRNEKLRVLQELYQLRLAHLLSAAEAILARGQPPGLQAIYQQECDSAIEAVRALDREHLERIHEQHRLFEERWKPAEREHVLRHRKELRAILDDCSIVCIAGGHVSILLRRLRLFGFQELLTRQPLIAWSAGAMVASERVVLFHDDPPQGAGSAEVYEAGLGIATGIVPLPHADKRLELGDRRRVSLFARRFAPDLCAALPPKTRLDFENGRWAAQSGTRLLTHNGELRELEVGT